MKKKFILLALTLLTVLGGVNLNVLNAQEDVVVVHENALSTAPNYPIAFQTSYNFSQHIYVQSDLNHGAGIIDKIAFKVSTSASGNRNITLYLKNTSLTTLTSGWETGSTQVFQATLDPHANNDGWLEFDIDDFEYDGTNILVSCYDNTGSGYTNGGWAGNCYVSVSGDVTRSFTNASSLYLNGDNVPGNDGGTSQRQPALKLYFAEPEDDIVPAAPTNLVASVVDHQSVALTWETGENAKRYNVHVYKDGAEIEGSPYTATETSYTVTGLEAETTYTFKVQSVRGSNLSEDFSNEATATTLKAPATRNIVFVLTDSYDDGWNGSAYLHIDATDGINEKLYLSTGGKAEYPIEITEGATVYVTYMRETNTWPEENAYCIYYDSETDGNEIYCSPTMDNTSARSYTFTVEAATPKVTAEASDYEIYSDETTTLIATAANFEGEVSYSWSPAEDLDDAASATPTFTPTAAGEYTFTCTATDTQGNEASDDVTISVGERPALDLNVTASKPQIYKGQYTTLNASVIGGFSPYTYSWTIGEDEVATSATYSFTNTEVGTYTITCTVTDANGGTIEKSVDVEVLESAIKPNKQYRIKALSYNTKLGDNDYYGPYPFSSNMYIHITSHSSNDEALVHVRPYEETPDQIFTFEPTNTDNVYYLRSADGYYLHCYPWHVVAYSTYQTSASPIGVSFIDDTRFYLMNGNAYFKAEQNEGEYKLYCDFTEVAKTATWTLEEVLASPENLIASDYQLYPGESTTISWDAFEGAAKYNIYVNGVSVGNTTELSYELSGLAYNMNPGNKIEVAAVLEGGSESGKASVTVQVAGTFTLTVNVKDNNGNAIEGATVSVTPDNFATDEFGNPIESLENATTDADGKAVFNGVKLLNTNSYCAYSISATMGLYGKHTTTPITNYAGVQNGENYKAEIVMTLPAPQNVTADKEYYDEGDEVVLRWESPLRALVGYNVYEYKYGEDNYETQINDELVQDLTYTIESVEYGVNYAVTAVYDEGESEKENANVQVLGKGTLKVTVTDGVNPIAGATVNVSGYVYPIGEYNETFTTNAEGLVEEYVYVGDYYVTASKLDTHYEATESNNTYVTYNTPSEVEIVLAAKPAATTVTSVTAALNGNNAEVTWTGSAEKYNVYRKNVATSEITSLSQETTETTYTDTDWELLTSGKYQYGVSELAGGGSETLLNESFEEISLPLNSEDKSIWSTTSNRLAIVSTYAHTGSKSVRVQSTGFSAQGGTLCSPAITVGESDPTLSFYYINKNDDNTTGKGEIAVQVYDESLGGAFTIETITAEANDFTLYEKKLEGFSGKTIRIYLDIKNYYYAETIIDDVVVSTAASSVESQIVWSDEIEKKGANTFEGTVSTDWNVAENWSNGVVPAEGDKAIVNANAVISSDVKVSTLDIVGNGSVTVDANATLTVTGAITQEYSYNMVLMEGGQIFQNNTNVTAVFRMDIANPENWNDATAKDGWQFVSSPMSDASIDDFLPITANYDFYKYDGNEENEWRNIKAGGNFESTFQQGAGYLVSFENDEEGAKMYGTLYEGNTYSWSNLLYNSEKPIANWNLVGNPFPFDMQWSKFAENIYNVVDGYAVVNNNGGYDYYTTGDIKVGGAFFVQTTGTGPEMYYSHALRGAKAESDNSVSLIATGKAGKDNVVIKLGGASEGFNKLQNFNDEIATVYVAEAGRRYGIVNLDSDTEEVEVSFDAKMMGSYTISAVPQGKFSSVVLLDRVTGIETDMLAGSYTFTAGSSDNVNRFVLKLSEDTSIDENFVYQSGEELIINAEGTVQIIDVMGRMVYSNDVVGDNNRINVSEFNNAAYIVRVINAEGIKVQKVVVY